MHHGLDDRETPMGVLVLAMVQPQYSGVLYTADPGGQLDPDGAPSLRINAVLGLGEQLVSGRATPDVFLLAAGRLGVVPEQCTVFEDLLVAMRSAKSVGMRVWAIHDDSSDGDWPDICGLADGVLFDFSEAPRSL